jgi:exodeoxyribonuclease V alpha subunit
MARKKIVVATSGAPSASSLTARQAQNLLANGCLAGATATLARNLVDRFGPKVFDEILASDPDARRLCGSRWDELYEAVEKRQAHFPLMAWMAEHGATSWLVERAADWSVDPENDLAESDPSVYFNRLKKDPHLLSDAPGIGFIRADGFALRSGVEPGGAKRQLACARAALAEACDNAGGGARLGEVEKKMFVFLKANEALPDPEARKLSTPALDLARQKGLLKDAKDENGRPMVFSADFHKAEEDCSHILLRMTKDPSPYEGVEIGQAVADAQAATGLTLLDKQREAVNVLFQGRVAIISGKPGAGKTTLLKCVAPILEKGGRQVFYAAPTGKAAKRMRQSIERQTSTIHRMLGIGRGGKRQGGDDDKDNPLKNASAVVIDEASMLDVKLMLSILRSMGPKTLLVLVGDPGQLPSIRAGKVLADLMDSHAFPCARLNDIVRQGAHSDIVKVARSIDEGVAPDFELRPGSPPERKTSDCLFLEEPDAQKLGARIVNLLRHAQQKGGHDPLRDAQVIAASNVGPAGATALNVVLQAAFNPPASGKNEVEVRRTVKGVDQSYFLRLGDKVMQTVNEAAKTLHKGAGESSEVLKEQGIFNGDVGFIESVDRNGSMWVQFDNGYAHFSAEEARKSLQLSYANTVHKFQGSESPLIFFAMHESTPMPLLTRNLAYTAITRAKNKCFVIGSARKLKYAASVDALATRHTRLKGLLNGSITPESAPQDVLAIFEERALERILDQQHEAHEKTLAEQAAAMPASAHGELVLAGSAASAESEPPKKARRL